MSDLATKLYLKHFPEMADEEEYYDRKIKKYKILLVILPLPITLLLLVLMGMNLEEIFR